MGSQSGCGTGSGSLQWKGESHSERESLRENFHWRGTLHPVYPPALVCGSSVVVSARVPCSPPTAGGEITASWGSDAASWGGDVGSAACTGLSLEWPIHRAGRIPAADIHPMRIKVSW